MPRARPGPALTGGVSGNGCEQLQRLQDKTGRRIGARLSWQTSGGAGGACSPSPGRRLGRGSGRWGWRIVCPSTWSTTVSASSSIIAIPTRGGLLRGAVARLPSRRVLRPPRRAGPTGRVGIHGRGAGEHGPPAHVGLPVTPQDRTPSVYTLDADRRDSDDADRMIRPIGTTSPNGYPFQTAVQKQPVSRISTGSTRHARPAPF